MMGPYGTRWSDVDEAPDVIAREDARFMTALGIWNAENALRPPEPDEMPGQPWEPHPDSLRGQVLELYRKQDEAIATLRATRRGRLLLRVIAIRSRLVWLFRRP